MSENGNELNMDAMNDIYKLLQLAPSLGSKIGDSIDSNLIQSTIGEMSSMVAEIEAIAGKHGCNLRQFEVTFYPMYDVSNDNVRNKYILICMGVNRKGEHLKNILPQLRELGVGHTGFLGLLAEYVNYIEYSKKELTKLENNEE